MKLIDVCDKRSEKLFLDTARKIYTNDKVWVCPLDNDIAAVFDPARNPYFKHGTARRWVLTDDSNNLIGRIAAFIDHNMANSYDQPTGGMGFFECINDNEDDGIMFVGFCILLEL